MYNEVSNFLKLTWLRDLVKEMCNMSLHGWKQNAICEF